MARGFGTTDGAATTDVVTTTYATDHTQMTWAMWIWITGAGGGSFGRVVTNTAGDRTMWYDSAGGIFLWTVGFTTFGGQWSIAIPSTGAWHHLAWTYDAGSTANDPIMYVDGSSVTVTEVQAPSGTLLTTGTAFLIGNRNDGIRHWNGKIAEVAHWNRILSAGEIATLGTSGFTPGCIKSGLVAYWPLQGTASPEPELIAAANGTLTGTATQTHPTVRQPSLPHSGRLGRILKGRL